MIPDLSPLRLVVEKIFDEQFDDHTLYNISAGCVFSQYPIIHTALSALNLNSHQIEMLTASGLLRSPHLGLADSEMTQRATLDAALRRQGDYFLTLGQLSSELCPGLAKHIQSFKALACSKPQTLRLWAHTFSQQLNALGWPGERSLNQEEFQVVERFHDVLNEFAALDLHNKEINFQEALKNLQRLCDQTQFQAQTPDAPIQVLGLLEAAGLVFDELWVTGLHDETWPASASPDPFIPYALQREQSMPHANAERELIFSERMTKRFSESARQVIFSYPTQCDDRELRPSSLIQNVATLSLSDLELPAPKNIVHEMFITGDIETLEDNIAPVIRQDERIRGGTFIFKHQAACPFRAFAEFRLHADSIDEPTLGFDALERGMLVHSALDHAWNTLKDHKTLCGIEVEALSDVIGTAVEAAIGDCLGCDTSRLQAIEKKRLEKLVFNWLQLEKARPPFKVLETESRLETELAGIKIKMQVDRIDELTTGEQVLIDYKTGFTKVTDWFEDRPNEPQLPLYAISSKSTIQGIMFAQLKPNQMRFRGITAIETDFPDLISMEKFNYEFAEDTWDGQVKSWENILTNLSKQFQKGRAEVDPKDDSSCDYCDLQALCRIHDV